MAAAMLGRKSDPRWKAKCDDAIAKLQHEEDCVNIISAPYLTCADACRKVQKLHSFCFNPDTDFPSFGIPNNSTGNARLYCWLEVAKIAARKGGTAHFFWANGENLLGGAQTTHLDACLHSHLNIRWYDSAAVPRSEARGMRRFSKALLRPCFRSMVLNIGVIIAFFCCFAAFAFPYIETVSKPAINMAVWVHRNHTGEVFRLEHHGFSITSKWTVAELREALYSLTDVLPKDQRLQFSGTGLASGLLDRPSYVLGRVCPAGEIWLCFRKEISVPPVLEIRMLEDATKFPRTTIPCLLDQVPHGLFTFHQEQHKLFGSWTVMRGQLHHFQLAAGSNVVGVLSPKISWTGEMQVQKLPRNTTTFAFSYPVQMRIRVQGQMSDQAPIRQFFQSGGYVFFDHKEQIVHIASIRSVNATQRETSVIRFGASQRWKKESVIQLEQQRRFQPVTLHSLRQEGATQFCWVGKGEELGPSRKKLPSGGFVYTFNDGAYRYFPIQADWFSLSSWFS